MATKPIGRAVPDSFHTAPRKNFPNLTGVRALAAIWVVLFHTGISGGSLGVDIFFVLSGFVLSEVYVSGLPAVFEWRWYRKFLIKRLAKIYPIHLLTFVAMAVVILSARAMHYPFVVASENTIWSAVANLLLIHSLGVTRHLGWNYPSWSVSAEWVAYSVIFAPMVFGLRRVRVRLVAILSAVLWVGFLALCRWGLHSGIDLTTAGALRIVPEFFGGYLLYRVLATTKPGAFGGGWYVFGGAAAIGAVALSAGRLDLLLLPAVMVLLAGLYSGGKIIDPIFSNRFLIAIGEASYSIYMVQAFVILLARQFVRRLHLGVAWKYGVNGVVAVLVVLLGSWVYSKVEEPLRRAVLKTLLSESRVEAKPPARAQVEPVSTNKTGLRA